MSNQSGFFTNPKYLNNATLEREYAAIHSDEFTDTVTSDAITPTMREWLCEHAQDVEREYTRRNETETLYALNEFLGFPGV